MSYKVKAWLEGQGENGDTFRIVDLIDAGLQTLTNESIERFLSKGESLAITHLIRIAQHFVYPNGVPEALRIQIGRR